MGIKVWIMKGEVYGKRDLSPLVGMDKKAATPSNSGKQNSFPNKPGNNKPRAKKK
jgi:small subunit ribosomal protein S3